MNLNDSQKDTILFYDGDCGFCHSMVALVLKNERDHQIYFCALQSAKAKEILATAGLQMIDPETVYFMDNGKLLQRSDAALKVVDHLKWYYRWLRVFRFVPKSWRDFFYDFIARRREKLRKGFCRVHLTHQKDRFL